MSESLEDMWSRLTLTEEEQTDVVVDKSWADDSSEVGKKMFIR